MVNCNLHCIYLFIYLFTLHYHGKLQLALYIYIYMFEASTYEVQFGVKTMLRVWRCKFESVEKCE